MEYSVEKNHFEYYERYRILSRKLSRSLQKKICLKKAKRLLDADIESELGWFHWHQSKELTDNSSRIQQEIEQLLQGALIYDSQLSQIHEKLVEIEFTYVINAHRQQDSVSKNRHIRRFETYLDVLEHDKKQYWHQEKKSTVLR